MALMSIYQLTALDYTNKRCSYCFEDFQENESVVSHDGEGGLLHPKHKECVLYAISKAPNLNTCPDCFTPLDLESSEILLNPDQALSKLGERVSALGKTTGLITGSTGMMCGILCHIVPKTLFPVTLLATAICSFAGMAEKGLEGGAAAAAGTVMGAILPTFFFFITKDTPFQFPITATLGIFLSPFAGSVAAKVAAVATKAGVRTLVSIQQTQNIYTGLSHGKIILTSGLSH